MIVASMVTSSGAAVNIHNDRMAAPGSERERAVTADQRRAAYEILKGGARNDRGQKEAHGDDQRRRV